MYKLLLTIVMFTISLLANNNYKPTNNLELINYIKKYGIDNNQEIFTNNNLKLIIKKIYIKNRNYIYLIKTKNLTNKKINITKEIGKGIAVPEELEPNQEGYLILGNIYIVPNSLIENSLKEILTSKNLKLLKFNQESKIFIINNKIQEFTKKEWGSFISNKSFLTILSSVNTKINDNQVGYFVNGFIKLKNLNYYQPISLYFIINNNGKIDNLYITPNLKTFNYFKGL